MALLRSTYEGEYRPIAGAIAVRDERPEAGGPSPEPALDEQEYAEIGCGTLGRAGQGWLQLPAVDAPQRLWLEVYDTRPVPDPENWAEVMETPYRSPTGTVRLAGPVDAPLRLLDPGSYRMEVCTVREADGPAWRLRWWPDEPEQPPIWWRRTASLAQADAPTLAGDVYTVAAWSPGHRISITLRQLAQRLQAPADLVRAALGYASERKALEVDGDPDGSGELTLRVPGN